MKKFLVLVLMMLAQVGLAQKTRAVQLDADTTTRPSVGMYGIGVRSNVPYLVGNTGNTRRVAMFTDLNSKLNSPTTSTINYIQKWNGSGLVNGQIFDNGTNVGIGTPNPNEKLEVAESSGGRFILSDAGGASRRVLLMQSPRSGFDYARILGYNYGTSSPINLVLQDAGGNVGIGTPNPAEKLTVNGNIDLPFGANRYIKIGSSTNYFYNLQSVGDDFQILEAGSIPRFTIKYPSGNVGIGNPNPNSKLEVTGNIGLSPNAGSTRYVFIPTATDTYTGVLHMQSGAGSDGFGGAINLYGHSHATKPGWVVAGISAGAGTDGTATEGRFAVTNAALGNGTELFSVLRTGEIGIGNPNPAASAKLDIPSTTQGVLLPRMTTAQINLIASPANGLMVYNTDLNKLCVREGSSWRQVSTTAM